MLQPPVNDSGNDGAEAILLCPKHHVPGCQLQHVFDNNALCLRQGLCWLVLEVPSSDRGDALAGC